MKPSLIILSGGLDSTVSAFLAKQESDITCALYFNYGQRAAVAERLAVNEIARRLNCSLRVLDVAWLGRLGESALTDDEQVLPEIGLKDLDKKTRIKKSAAQVWVPNRNGVFLNIAAAIAESLGIAEIITGFNAEEAATFPDNSAAFVEATNRCFQYSTQNGVQVKSYTQDLDKTQIVRAGLEHDVPFNVIWSCYESGATMCARCESCQRSIRAYRDAGIWEQMQHRFGG